MDLYYRFEETEAKYRSIKSRDYFIGMREFSKA
jgi:hypothetical protein